MERAKPIWEKRKPDKPSVKLTKKEKEVARSMAKRAGRKYPNLVDNARVARKKKARKKSGARRGS